MKPNHLVFGSKGLPFFIIPATYYMYEWSEFRGQHVNEISRMSHFSAILFGLLSGVYFKRILWFYKHKKFKKNSTSEFNYRKRKYFPLLSCLVWYPNHRLKKYVDHKSALCPTYLDSDPPRPFHIWIPNTHPLIRYPIASLEHLVGKRDGKRPAKLALQRHNDSLHFEYSGYQIFEYVNRKNRWRRDYLSVNLQYGWCQPRDSWNWPILEDPSWNHLEIIWHHRLQKDRYNGLLSGSFQEHMTMLEISSSLFDAQVTDCHRLLELRPRLRCPN